MLSSLVMTALLMGVAGLGHCALMCGAPCAGAVRACAGSRATAQTGAAWFLQLGRALAYAALGALAATGMGGVRYASAHSELMRPLWAMAQAACLALGIWLMLRAQAPTWLDAWSWPLRAALRRLETSRLARWPVALKAMAVGLGWALLPCGQLYAAVAVAALAPAPEQGALVMAAFALPAAVSFVGLRSAWQRLRPGSNPSLAVAAGPREVQEGVPVVLSRSAQALASSRYAPWLMRLSGLGLTVASTWALVHMLSTPPSAWCVVH